MPFRDKTGPRGEGQMTGRGFGFCGDGKGMGRGMGFGRCRGFRSQEELNFYKKNLEQELEQVKEELKKLEEKK